MFTFHTLFPYFTWCVPAFFPHVSLHISFPFDCLTFSAWICYLFDVLSVSRHIIIYFFSSVCPTFSIFFIFHSFGCHFFAFFPLPLYLSLNFWTLYILRRVSMPQMIPFIFVLQLGLQNHQIALHSESYFMIIFLWSENHNFYCLHLCSGPLYCTHFQLQLENRRVICYKREALNEFVYSHYVRLHGIRFGIFFLLSLFLILFAQWKMANFRGCLKPLFCNSIRLYDAYSIWIGCLC